MTNSLKTLPYTPENIAELNDGELTSAVEISSLRLKAVQEERQKTLLAGGIMALPAWLGAVATVDFLENSAREKDEAAKLIQAFDRDEPIIPNAGESALYDQIGDACFSKITEKYWVEEKTDGKTGEVIEGHVGAPMSEVAQTFSTCVDQRLNEAANPNYVADLALPVALMVTAGLASAINFYRHFNLRTGVKERQAEVANVTAEVSRRAEAQFGSLQP